MVVGTKFTPTYMNLAVSSQVSTLSESFAAYIALERLLSRVSTHMDFQSARPHKTVVTKVTLEWPVACMSPKVVRQMSMRRKSPPAVVK